MILSVGFLIARCSSKLDYKAAAFDTMTQQVVTDSNSTKMTICIDCVFSVNEQRHHREGFLFCGDVAQPPCKKRGKYLHCGSFWFQLQRKEHLGSLQPCVTAHRNGNQSCSLFISINKRGIAVQWQIIQYCVPKEPRRDPKDDLPSPFKHACLSSL